MRHEKQPSPCLKRGSFCELHLGIQGYHNSCISSPHEACQRTVFLKYRKMPKYEWLLDGGGTSSTPRRIAGISSALAITSLKHMSGCWAYMHRLPSSGSPPRSTKLPLPHPSRCSSALGNLGSLRLHANFGDCFFIFFCGRVPKLTSRQSSWPCFWFCSWQLTYAWNAQTEARRCGEARKYHHARGTRRMLTTNCTKTTEKQLPTKWKKRPRKSLKHEKNITTQRKLAFLVVAKALPPHPRHE